MNESGERRAVDGTAPDSHADVGAKSLGVKVSSIVSFMKYVGILVALCALIVWGAVWMLDHPDSGAAQFFREASARYIPSDRAGTDDYLVFLADDTSNNRKQLMAVSASMSFVAESLLPDVVVVRIPDRTQTTLKGIQSLDFVRMVFKYTPSIGCH